MPQQLDRRIRIYCYAPQQRAVEYFLRPFMASGTVSLMLVREAEQLRGMDGQTFVMIAGHPARIPQHVHEVIATQGFIVWHIDDRMWRGRHGG